MLSLPSVCPWFCVSFLLVPGSCLWCFLLCLCFCLRFCGCLFLWPLCASLGVVGLLCVCSFLGCCWLPSLSLVASLPLWLVPLWCPGPVFVLVHPSGYLVAFATARLPCLNAWVWWCSVVLSLSLHHVAGVVAVLCTPTLRYSSADDPGQKVWPTPLLSSSAVPAPSLGVIVAVFFGCLCLPSLLSTSPALTEALEVWSSDCCESLLGLFVYVVNGCCISGKGKSSAR